VITICPTFLRRSLVDPYERKHLIPTLCQRLSPG
jgi:hypothetical protein